jgi:hypothetical protein
MNAQHDHSDGEGADAGLPLERIHASRRRFTRAGLSSSVVLGSLVSKPVLGAAPYHCTVSGQASGTLSRQGELGACRIGDSRLTWLNAADWTAAGLVKGSVPNSGCIFSPGNTSLFNGFTVQGVTLAATFWGQTGSSNCTLGTSSTNKPASMYQVLSYAGPDATLNLGSVVVVSLLNALKYQPNYGATPAQVIEMFNAVRTAGGSYSVAGRTWSQADVVGYLKLLYEP